MDLVYYDKIHNNNNNNNNNNKIYGFLPHGIDSMMMIVSIIFLMFYFFKYPVYFDQGESFFQIYIAYYMFFAIILYNKVHIVLNVISWAIIFTFNILEYMYIVAPLSKLMEEKNNCNLNMHICFAISRLGLLMYLTYKITYQISNYEKNMINPGNYKTNILKVVNNIIFLIISILILTNMDRVTSDNISMPLYPNCWAPIWFHPNYNVMFFIAIGLCIGLSVFRFSANYNGIFSKVSFIFFLLLIALYIINNYILIMVTSSSTLMQLVGYLLQFYALIMTAIIYYYDC